MAGVIIAAMHASSVHGAVAARHYDFEEGTAGEPASSVVDIVDDLVFEGPAEGVFATGHLWLEVPGGAGRPLPGANVQESVTNTALTATALEARQGMATYIDVSDGSSLDSPAIGSEVALSFVGNAYYDDTNTGPGSRGVYVDPVAFANNDAIVNQGNTVESFNLISQGWVRPSAEGFEVPQTVWQTGTEQGSVNINEDGFWEFRDFGSVGVLDPDIPVDFNAWTHIGLRRGGNGAEVYLNGELVAGNIDPPTPNYFNTFASLITLGGNAFGADGFIGLVDDFKVMGTADLRWDPLLDLDYWAQRPGVACDFNGDQACDTADLDALMADAANGTNNGTDLNGDNSVDTSDRDQWLALAGPENGLSGAYLLGDANLNGLVDSEDLNAVGISWQNTSVTAWSEGNFEIDGDGVNAVDLNALAIHWQQSAPLAASAVPEPSSAVFLLGSLLAMMLRRRKSWPTTI